uniref:Rieske domain-containing protein n=1 Tax=Macrostomum lignano TaxID=282301 RepID=A0A1I8GB99_9PLAT
MDSGWQQVGMVSDLAKVRCRRLFTERREDSIVLVHLRGQFFAMNAWCPHQGGPLFRGDIEDVNGQHCLVCPLHRYAFSLSDGTASCGLRQSTFECKEEAGQLYIRCPFRLSLQPL